jgi:hypothetical protein
MRLEISFHTFFRIFGSDDDVVWDEWHSTFLTHLVKIQSLSPILGTRGSGQVWSNLLRSLGTLVSDLVRKNNSSIPLFRLTFFDEASENIHSMITVGFLRLDLVEALSQLSDLLSLTVNALLSKSLLFFCLLHLNLGSSSFGSKLEEVDSSSLGFYIDDISR